jgi:hypothetical protein
MEIAKVSLLVRLTGFVKEVSLPYSQIKDEAGANGNHVNVTCMGTSTAILDGVERIAALVNGFKVVNVNVFDQGEYPFAFAARTRQK